MFREYMVSSILVVSLLCFVSVWAESHTAYVYDINGRHVATVQTHETIDRACIRFVRPTGGGTPRGWEDSVPLGIYVLLSEGVFENEAIIWGDREFGFEDVTDIYLPSEEWSALDVEVADLDRDGHLDIVFSRSEYACAGAHTSFPPRIWIQTIDGTFVDETEARCPAFAMPSWDVELFDADADGDTDIFLGGIDPSNYSPAVLLINDGNGVFSNESNERLPEIQRYSFVYRVQAGLIDDNDSIDLAMIIVPDPYNPDWLYGPEIWLNDGLGHFARDTEGRFPGGEYGFLDLLLDDIDNDSLNDLLFANIGIIFSDENGNPVDTLSGRTACYRNLGDGFFADETEERLPEVSTLTRGLSLSDIDADGDMDLLEVGLTIMGQPISVFLNDGTGHYSVSEFAFPDFVTWINEAEFGFLNDDEFPDLFMANVEPGAISSDYLFVNDGNGGFTDVSDLLPDRLDFSVACALFDHRDDSDIDILTANCGTGPGNNDLFGQNTLDQNLLNDSAGVRDDPLIAADTFRLSEISPNPLTNSTALHYSVPQASHVTLTIVDISGRRVATLVDGRRPAGDHTTTWRPSDLASGVYSCHLRADGQARAVRRIVVVR